MLSSETKQRLHRLTELFLEENAKLNLSAFRTESDCWIGNVLDSLAILDCPNFQLLPAGRHGSTFNFQLLDIGTGGGFPLLPLAIAVPDAQLTGLDATQKKIDAIQRITDRLELDNVQLICSRTEQAGRDPEHRERYDIVTARALAPLNVLLEYASPFVKPGGHVVAWKSMTIDTELHESLMARAELSCQLIDQYEYALPAEGWPASRSPAKAGAGWGKRQLVIFEKRGPISEKYPREVGIPKKKPLV